MLLKKVNVTVDNQIETVFLLTHEQYRVLLNHAILDLISRGLASVVEVNVETLDEETQKALENMKSFQQTLN